jgi:hypothetical protein
MAPSGESISLTASSTVSPRTSGRQSRESLRQSHYQCIARAYVHCRRLIDQPELAYAMTRYREVHDFLHVLTGLPPTVEGELALKTLEAVQTGLPMAALSAIAGPLALRDPRKISQWYGGAAPAVTTWAAICGRRSVPIHLLVRCVHLFSDLRVRTPAPACAFSCLVSVLYAPVIFQCSRMAVTTLGTVSMLQDVEAWLHRPLDEARTAWGYATSPPYMAMDEETREQTAVHWAERNQ